MRLLIITLFSAFIVGHIHAAEGEVIPAVGYAKPSAEGAFVRHEFARHPVGEHDVLIDILYSGICHSDIHTARSEWRAVSYPLVPGHEVVGRVVRIGSSVEKFAVGDIAGVGCMVNACGLCADCQAGEEQFCRQRVWTYGSTDHFHDDETTQGGYASNIVVAERFAIKVPKDADLKKVAPLFCAGITVYSPIQKAGINPGDRVGVAGFGGLGHMAVQYLVAMGAEVTVFDITEDKRQAAKDMGAARYVNVRQTEDLQNLEGFNFIISTIPAPYDPVSYMRMLKRGGELVIVGLPAWENMPQIPIGQLVYNAQRKVSGSLIGGIAETQAMLDYSVANEIYPEVEVIPVDQIDEAYNRVVAGAVKFRYVLDMSTLD